MTRVVAPGAEGARSIIDGGRYMTLATADAEGVPWATPVWYAPDGYAELLYHAVVSEHWMLGEDRDQRVPVNPQPS